VAPIWAWGTLRLQPSATDPSRAVPGQAALGVGVSPQPSLPEQSFDAASNASRHVPAQNVLAISSGATFRYANREGRGPSARKTRKLELRRGVSSGFRALFDT